MSPRSIAIALAKALRNHGSAIQYSDHIAEWADLITPAIQSAFDAGREEGLREALAAVGSIDALEECEEILAVEGYDTLRAAITQLLGEKPHGRDE